MEYKKGSIVEVLVSDGLFYNTWLCAKIVSGNGHTYTVSYNVYPSFTSKADVERVSVETIRPCPPLLEVAECCWARGDVVEVFHDLRWKSGVVLKDLDWDEVLVRATGVYPDLVVTKAELRVRQLYQNGEWVIENKVSKEHEYANFANRVSESYSESSRTLKRASSCCCYQYEANEERSIKFRACEEEESVMSSSGSCSTNSYKPYEVYRASGPVEDTESNAESVCRLGYNEYTAQSPTNEALTGGNHTRELLIYRSTMEGLYASGPLSWEKETMVTNLRMLLHISNDEHLVMLKCLKSANSDARSR